MKGGRLRTLGMVVVGMLRVFLFTLMRRVTCIPSAHACACAPISTVYPWGKSLKRVYVRRFSQRSVRGGGALLKWPPRPVCDTRSLRQTILSQGVALEVHLPPAVQQGLPSPIICVFTRIDQGLGQNIYGKLAPYDVFKRVSIPANTNTQYESEALRTQFALGAELAGHRSQKHASPILNVSQG